MTDLWVTHSFHLHFAVGISAMKIPKDTNKLKKHIALMCDRLNKGGKLDLSMTSSQQAGEPPVQQQSQKPVTPMEPLNEEDDDEMGEMKFVCRHTKKALKPSSQGMMGWEGMGWNGRGWDGRGWDGREWNGRGWEGRLFCWDWRYENL